MSAVGLIIFASQPADHESDLCIWVQLPAQAVTAGEKDFVLEYLIRTTNTHTQLCLRAYSVGVPGLVMWVGAHICCLAVFSWLLFL